MATEPLAAAEVVGWAAPRRATIEEYRRINRSSRTRYEASSQSGQGDAPVARRQLGRARLDGPLRLAHDERC